MNLPNILTMSRFVLAVLFVVLLLRNSFAATIIAAAVFTIAALTDLLDGYFAKKHGFVSDFGKIMDPIADKFLILAAFFVFAEMGVVQGWMVLLIFIREVVVTASRVMRLRRGQVIAAEKAGKIKTVFQIICVSATLLFLILEKSSFAENWSASVENGWVVFINLLMFVTVLLTVNSGVSYFLNLPESAARS